MKNRQKYTQQSGIKELLGIGDKTLQRYRDEGKLRFHQGKDKFWYTQADVDELLPTMKWSLTPTPTKSFLRTWL